MPLPGMPDDLKQRVAEANDMLDAIEKKLAALEATSKKQLEAMAGEVKELRHDFNNARSVINALMFEIDQRDPMTTRKK